MFVTHKVARPLCCHQLRTGPQRVAGSVATTVSASQCAIKSFAYPQHSQNYIQLATELFQEDKENISMSENRKRY